jgi:CubicO group peptidase (beta-lactamase class C family)
MVALVLGAAPVWAGELSESAMNRMGFDKDRLGRISTFFEDRVDEGQLAGAITLVAREGQTIHFNTVGAQNMEEGKAMQEDTIFRIYSMSKPIVSTALMMLYEEGLFVLTDPLSRYMPEMSDMEVLVESTDAETGEVTYTTVPAEREITVQDVLRHTTGFIYDGDDSELGRRYREAGVRTDDKTLTETIEKLGRLPLAHQPGTTWHYSVSSDVAGRLVEIVSGMPLDQYLQERIFAPLGMEDTFFTVPENKRDRMSRVYRLNDEGKVEYNESESGPSVLHEGYFSGGGGLFGTTSDYLKFCQMMLNKGELNGVRLLGSRTVDFMMRDHLGDVQNGFVWEDGAGFGLGFQVILDTGANGRLGSDGLCKWGGYAGTRFWIDPEEQLIGIYMIQIVPDTNRRDYGQEFRSMVYQALVD